MQKLVAGVHHFQANLFSSQRELFAHLARGQDPEVLFITCSDSRVVPNLITNTDPGDLFILRNAGNIVPPYGTAPDSGEAATIEYAVGALGVKDIIVCGHTHCGAMSAVLHPEDAAELPAVAAWLAHAAKTRTIIDENYPDLSGEALRTATVEENVLVQIENLRTHPLVASGVAAGTLHLHGWVYHLAVGEVFAFDPAQGQFLDLTPEPGAPPHASAGPIRPRGKAI